MEQIILWLQLSFQFMLQKPPTVRRQSDPTKYALQMNKNIHKQDTVKLKSTRCINVTHIKCISNTIAISLQLLYLTQHQVLAEHITKFTSVHNGTVARAAQLRKKNPTQNNLIPCWISVCYYRSATQKQAKLQEQLSPTPFYFLFSLAI